MAITIKVGDLEVTVSDAAEAATLIRELRGESAAKSPRPTSNGATQDADFAERIPIDKDIVPSALRFLNLIQRSPKGARKDEVMKALEVEKAEAIGSRSARINKLLDQVGFGKELVYDNPKKPGHERVWYPGRHLGKAIEAIEEQVAR